jgi:hypothetical protein
MNTNNKKYFQNYKFEFLKILVLYKILLKLS